MANDEYSGKPYKIIDSKRKHKIGIVANSLADFMTKGKIIFWKTINIPVYLLIINLCNINTVD